MALIKDFQVLAEKGVLSTNCDQFQMVCICSVAGLLFLTVMLPKDEQGNARVAMMSLKTGKEPLPRKGEPLTQYFKEPLFAKVNQKGVVLEMGLDSPVDIEFNALLKKARVS